MHVGTSAMTTPERPLHIAAASRPGSDSSIATTAATMPPGDPTHMLYNCQPCVRRKVKCDRSTPMCSSCAKSRQKCFYQAPPKPRRKKRRLGDTVDDSDNKTPDNDDLRDRLARYERLLRDNGLLPSVDAAQSVSGVAPLSSKLTPQNSTTQDSPAPSPATGKLVSVGGKTRYIDSRIWLETGEESMQDCSDPTDPNEHDDPAPDQHSGPINSTAMLPSYDPVSGALLGRSVNLPGFHPSTQDARKLWTIHVEFVEPLIRIVHVATTAKMIETVTQQPHTASKAQECLLFAIYNFAVVALDEDDCQREFGQSREFLLNKYGYGLKQALVNAQWLATTEIMVFQALLLYLIAARGHLSSYDPQTFWIMTGIAVRIAQRMGLHLDGESLGLPPFEVQMRRRLFWQLLPLENFAGQHSGTGIALSASSWDTKKPLNISDSDIHPGMTQMPEESKGATDMMYIMARNELTDMHVRKTSIRDDCAASKEILNERMLRMIDILEDTLEQKVFRYCDVINPLHFQTLLIFRAAINAIRLRHQTHLIRDSTIDDAERTRLCHIAEKILDSDATMCVNPRVKNYRWQVQSFFLWDSVICILTSLTKPGFFTGAWLDATWDRLSQFYANHPDVLLKQSTMQISAIKATLKAWTANPPSNRSPEPEYIVRFRAHREERDKRKMAKLKATDGEESTKGGKIPANGLSEAAGVTSSYDSPFEDWQGLTASNFDTPISPGIGDWGFWDHFFQHAGPDHG